MPTWKWSSARTVIVSGQRDRRELDRLEDSLVPGAAAEVPRQSFAHLVLQGTRVVAQQRRDRHDEARCAETALQTVCIPECRLNRRESAVRRAESFDRRDLALV